MEEQAEGISSADIINDEDLKRVEQIKLKSTGIVKRAFEVEENHRKLTLQETSDLLAILNDRFKKSGLSVGDFEDQVLKRIHRDLEIINAFNKMLESSADTYYGNNNEFFDFCSMINFLFRVVTYFKTLKHIIHNLQLCSGVSNESYSLWCRKSGSLRKTTQFNEKLWWRTSIRWK